MLTEREAYEAMYRFIEAFWERCKKKGSKDDIVFLLTNMGYSPSDDRDVLETSDPAYWHDSLEAIAAVRSSAANGE